MKEYNNERLVDMHFHTSYSDGSTKIKTVVKLCKKHDYGVAITDHNEIKGALKLAKTKVFNIPALELGSKERIDFIYYFYDIKELKEFYEKEIKKLKNKKCPFTSLNIYADELLDIGKRYNCVKCLPHPFSISKSLGIKVKRDNGVYVYKGIKKPRKEYLKLVKDVDIIEVMNGNMLKRKNNKAMWLANKLNKPYCGGSDGHIRYSLGKVLTICNGENVEEFLKGILKKKNKVFVYGSNFPRIILSNSSALRKHFRHPILHTGKIIKSFNKKIISKPL
jgi:predicted metal-dependent phosphoesterase TrpH